MNNTAYRNTLTVMVWLIHYCKVPNNMVFFIPVYSIFLLQEKVSKMIWRCRRYLSLLINGNTTRGDVIVTDIKTLEQMTGAEWREHMKDDPYYKLALVLMAKRKAGEAYAEEPTEDQITFNHLRGNQI